MIVDDYFNINYSNLHLIDHLDIIYYKKKKITYVNFTLKNINYDIPLYDLFNSIYSKKLKLIYGIIYCIIFPNNKKYIGQTKQGIRKRLYTHVKKSSDVNSIDYINQAIRKYAIEPKEKLNVIILDYAYNSYILNKKEIKYIKDNKTNEFKYGYNIALGGTKRYILK